MLTLLSLHGADGQPFYVNEEQITTLRQPIDKDLRRYFPKGSRCIIVMTNGKFLPVRETCEEVYDIIRQTAPPAEPATPER